MDIGEFLEQGNGSYTEHLKHIKSIDSITSNITREVAAK